MQSREVEIVFILFHNRVANTAHSHATAVGGFN